MFNFIKNLFVKKIETPFGLGGNKSKEDPRTVQHSDLVQSGILLVKGGYQYLPEDILNQSKVGICTAISLVQMANKTHGKKYSADFQYLLQKKYVDNNWSEGSSIFAALKIANKYGFLHEDFMNQYVIEADRALPYSQYIAKLQAIPEYIIFHLMTLCENSIAGYAQVGTDPQSIARAIDTSKAGILVRYEVGDTWWFPNWTPAAINPLRKPKTVISGHAIIKSAYDYTFGNMSSLANTWTTAWNKQGCADVNLDAYLPTEAWVIVETVLFVRDLAIGDTNIEVQRVQQFLNAHGYIVSQNGAGSPGNETYFFGQLTKIAVQTFQKANNLPITGFWGKLTRTCANNKL